VAQPDRPHIHISRRDFFRIGAAVGGTALLAAAGAASAPATATEATSPLAPVGPDINSQGPNFAPVDANGQPPVEFRRPESTPTAVAQGNVEQGVDFLSPAAINGVETYGHEAPLTQEQFYSIMDDLRTKSEIASPRSDKEYLGAYIVTKEVYDAFAALNDGRTLQEYLTDVYTQVTDMLPPGFEAKIKYVFVTNGNIFEANDNYPPASWNVDFYNRGPFKAFDGWRGYPWDTIPEYATIAADRHEIFHRVFRYTDDYWIDFYADQAALAQHWLQLASYSPAIRDRIANKLKVASENLEGHLQNIIQRARLQTAQPDSVISQAFRDVRPDSQVYVVNRRTDIYDPERNKPGNGNSVMAHFETVGITTCIAEILKDRDENDYAHDVLQTLQQHDGFPVEGFMADRNVLNLGPDFNRYKVTVYGTQETSGSGRTLVEITSGEVRDGKFDIGCPFVGRTQWIYGREGVPGERAGIFIRVEDPNNPNKPFYTWLDARDFIAWYLMTDKPVQGVEVDIALMDKNTPFADNDWDSNLRVRALPELPVDTPTPSRTAVPPSKTPTVVVPTRVPQPYQIRLPMIRS
jgi:hypothetical protein